MVLTCSRSLTVTTVSSSETSSSMGRKYKCSLRTPWSPKSKKRCTPPSSCTSPSSRTLAGSCLELLPCAYCTHGNLPKHREACDASNRNDSGLASALGRGGSGSVRTTATPPEPQRHLDGGRAHAVARCCARPHKCRGAP